MKSASGFSVSIVGGIGDIIFGLDGIESLSKAMNTKVHCYISTHIDDGYALVKNHPFVNSTSKIPFEKNLSHLNILNEKTNKDMNYVGEAFKFSFTPNPKIYLSNKDIQLATKFISALPNQGKQIIIHPCGSDFSRYFLGHVRNVSTKELPTSTWKKIIDTIQTVLYRPNIILIGSKEDKPILDDMANGTDAIVCAGTLSIPTCMAVITKSSLVLAVDSFAKSVSLASKIPSIVFVNDHEDPYRDDVFLAPYKNEYYANIIRNANKLDLDAELIPSIKFMCETI